MRAAFQHPASRVALFVGFSALALEGIIYFDHGRHATARELTVMTVATGLLIGILELTLPKGRYESLGSIVRIVGISQIGHIVEKLEDPLLSWPDHVAKSIVLVLCGALIGAGIDNAKECRREKT